MVPAQTSITLSPLSRSLTEEMFYEILCRGKDKCGTFVSSVKIDRCPKCKSAKVLIREMPRDLEKD